MVVTDDARFCCGLLFLHVDALFAFCGKLLEPHWFFDAREFEDGVG